jgi:16S rRNA (cytosine967-C5)-methyltransferase
LPGFREGWISVQDGAAQLAAQLLDPQPGERILDACAAPGGKTGHLLELQPALAELVAVDDDAARMARVRENLERLGLRASLVVEDAGAVQGWWDGVPFDRILLDAPCSGSGVIRRHPDIKYLRRSADIAVLAAEQQRLLTALWPLVRRGGMLLYVTCSVLPEEDEFQVQSFLEAHDDAREEPLAVSWGRALPHGRLVLPGMDGMDGFYYASLKKR